MINNFPQTIDRQLKKGNLAKAKSAFARMLNKTAKSNIFHLVTLSRYFNELQIDPSEANDSFPDILRELNCYAPKNSKFAKLQISNLIELFRPDLAVMILERSKQLLSHEDYRGFKEIAERNLELLSYFGADLDKIWVDSFSPLTDKTIIFHIPGVFRKLDPKLSPLYEDIVKFSYNLFDSLKEYSTQSPTLIFQFNWKRIRQFSNDQVVISYHTRDNGPGAHIRFKEAPFPKFFTVDSKGYSGWHSTADISLTDILESVKDIPMEVIEDNFDELHGSFAVKNYSKYEQPKRSQFVEVISNDYYFLPLQIVDDEVAELAFISTVNLCEFLIKLARKDGIKLVIKRHPKCNSKRVTRLLRVAARHKNIVISDASIHDLIKNCKAVVTVNSGVGLEALLHLKPVITTGKSEYQAVTYQVKSTDELLTLIKSEGTELTERFSIKAFLFFYFKDVVFDINNIERLKSKLSSVNQFSVPSQRTANHSSLNPRQ